MVAESVREAGEKRAGDGIPKGPGVGRNRKRISGTGSTREPGVQGTGGGSKYR